MADPVVRLTANLTLDVAPKRQTLVALSVSMN